LSLFALSFLALSAIVQAGEPVSLFKFSLDNWEFKSGKGTSKWQVAVVALNPDDPKQLLGKNSGSGIGSDADLPSLANFATKHGDSVDIYSKQKFGSCLIELEVMVPKGSNSGIYVMGEYEVQVFDSSGKADDKMGPGDMGAIYGAAVPKVNACKAPGEWQKYVIEWQAPKFDAEGKKVANAKFIKVELNGKVMHENLEMPGPTPSGVTGKETAEGPIMFQGDHGPVAYQNIKITPR
ncbi:MAG: DUF1080 domain-containing protein, partial [Roseimicrobium sp.]